MYVVSHHFKRDDYLYPFIINENRPPLLPLEIDSTIVTLLYYFASEKSKSEYLKNFLGAQFFIIKIFDNGDPC